MSIETRANIANVAVQHLPDALYSDLTPEELLDRKIRTERQEWIPVEDIILDEGVVDSSHVEALASSISGDRGMISPTVLRPRFLDNTRLVVYDVIDGFHRGNSLRLLGVSHANSIIVYGCSDEELFDLRVLAANSVKSVQWARLAMWMQRSFEHTAWYEKGLKLSQIFGLLAVKSASGSRMGLEPQEAEIAKDWALNKARAWKKPASTIWSMARTFEVANPALIEHVRVGGGGKRSRKGELSPARLIAIVTHLPNEFDLQSQVAEIVTTHNFIAGEAELIAKAVAANKDSPHAVTDILSNPYVVIERVRENNLSPTEKTMLRLSKEVKRLSSMLEQALRPDAKSFWWRTFPGLSRQERNLLVLMLDQGMEVDSASYEVGVLPTQALKLAQSAFRKYSFFIREGEIAGEED